MLRIFEITLKQGAPATCIDEEGLEKRWKDAVKNKEKYLETMVGTYRVDAVIGIGDLTKSRKAHTAFEKQQKEMGLDETKGIYTPGGPDILGPGRN